MNRQQTVLFFAVAAILLVLLFSARHFSATRQALALQVAHERVQPLDESAPRHGMVIWPTRSDGHKSVDSLVIHYDQGIKDGPVRQRYIDGTLLSSGTCANGEPEGRWIAYYPDGQPRREAFFTSGSLEGEMREWNKEGKLASRMLFSDGQRHGTSVFYYPSGPKHIEITFEKGLRQGLSPRWNRDGSLKRTVYFDNDQRIPAPDTSN